MKSPARFSLLVLIMSVMHTSCAPTTGTVADVSETERQTRASRNVITATEIERSTLSTVQDLVLAIRPSWLRSHDESLSGPVGVDVYVDGVPSSSVLSDIQLNQVSRLEYLSASEATLQFGIQRGERCDSDNDKARALSGHLPQRRSATAFAGCSD